MNHLALARTLPLALAFALTACNSGDGTEDKDTTDKVVDTNDETGETGSVNTAFQPDTISYASDFAVGTDGQLSNFSIQGQSVPSTFIVTMSDGRDECALVMVMDPETAGHLGQRITPVDTDVDTDADTDADTDPETDVDTDVVASELDDELLDWLDDNGMFFGFRVQAGKFDGVQDGSACAELDETRYGTDPFAWVLGDAADAAFFVGIKTTVSSEIQDEADQLLDGANIPAAKVFGGRLKFSFEFGSPDGGQTDFFDIVGISAATTGEANEVADDGAGNFALEDALSLWDGSDPAPNFYRLISPFVLTFTF